MLEILSIGLVASLAVAGVTGAIIASWRMIPHRPGADVPTARLEAVEEAVDGLRLSLIDLADKYEIMTKRNATRVGKLRRKVRRLEGEDPDEDEDVEPAPELPLPTAVPCAPAPMTKLQMHQQWAAQQQAGRTA